MIHDPGPWNPPVGAQRDDRRPPAPVVACSLCGIQLPAHQMVPDGGQACADVRWYCRDARSCTERWTARLGRPGPAAGAQDRPPPLAAAHEARDMPAAGAEEPRPHRMPAAWLGGPPDME